MNLNIFDYKHKAHDTGIPVKDVNSLYVIVLSGDEIITAVMNDGKQKVVDVMSITGETRGIDFFDGEYGVHKDDLDEWLKRVDAYDWFGTLLKKSEEAREC